MSGLRGKGMALYHLTLTTATAIPHAVYGNFSAKGQSEICASRGKVLQLLRPDNDGRIQVCLPHMQTEGATSEELCCCCSGHCYNARLLCVAVSSPRCKCHWRECRVKYKAIVCQPAELILHA